MVITIIAVILLIVSIKLTLDAKNQREIDRLEMVDLELKFEKLEERLVKLLKKIKRNGKD